LICLSNSFRYLWEAIKKKLLPPKKAFKTESVYASVIVQPDSLNIGTNAPVGRYFGFIICWKEGDLVRKRTPMVQIVNNTPKLNSANARLALELGEDKL